MRALGTLRGEEKQVAVKSNRCPKCGGRVELCEERHSLVVYQVLPDGTVDESSGRVLEGAFDDDGSLKLVCEKCSVIVAEGYRRAGGLSLDDLEDVEVS